MKSTGLSPAACRLDTRGGATAERVPGPARAADGVALGGGGGGTVMERATGRGGAVLTDATLVPTMSPSSSSIVANDGRGTDAGGGATNASSSTHSTGAVDVDGEGARTLQGWSAGRTTTPLAGGTVLRRASARDREE